MSLIGDLRHDRHTLTNEEFLEKYGLEVEDEYVLDPTYNKKFKNVGEWIDFEVDNDPYDKSYGSYDEY